MKIFRPLLVLALCACGAPQQGSLPATQAQPASSTAAHNAGSRSWMAKGLKQRDLLYVTNANGTVNVYRYQQHTLVGVLTRFSHPQGECSAFDGNVYITDYGTDSIDEYEHGATKPLHTIDESPAVPYGCAISPKTGDLAVANFNSSYDAPGTIDIYPHGSGKPIVYQATNEDHFVFCVYDDRGDLLVLSHHYYYSYRYMYDFYYLPKNGTKLIAMSIPGPSYSRWETIEGLGWDGKYWIVQSYDDLYQFTIDVKAQQVGEVKLTGVNGIGPVAYYRLTSKSMATQVVGASLNSVDYWHYPAGGSPIGSITKDLDSPYGVAISLKSGT